jgi:predicted enzyme related to lactoylglutathione lyase
LAAPGAWIWSSLLTHDLDAEAAFYQTVFGYEVFELESNDGMEHVILSTDDYARASVNALPADSAHRHPHWLNFVRVADAADAATRAVAHWAAACSCASRRSPWRQARGHCRSRGSAVRRHGMERRRWQGGS